ncbi:hypothetical protein BN11_1700011 [Nostocoides australiense Ben110]|uniref:Uncharacterized protein n=1 Tax=Nostocoides australiense Ben110 TaxID=1193182 RepID=W6JT84_9MICO|nr:hypothetical protein BN11_1700011 [Tetrasphaera australiensis Ben110]
MCHERASTVDRPDDLIVPTPRPPRIIVVTSVIMAGVEDGRVLETEHGVGYALVDLPPQVPTGSRVHVRGWVDHERRTTLNQGPVLVVSQVEAMPEDVPADVTADMTGPPPEGGGPA